MSEGPGLAVPEACLDIFEGIFQEIITSPIVIQGRSPMGLPIPEESERSERKAVSKKDADSCLKWFYKKKWLTVASAFIMEYIKAGEEWEVSRQETIKTKELDKEGNRDRKD